MSDTPFLLDEPVFVLGCTVSDNLYRYYFVGAVFFFLLGKAVFLVFFARIRGSSLGNVRLLHRNVIQSGLTVLSFPAPPSLPPCLPPPFMLTSLLRTRVRVFSSLIFLSFFFVSFALCFFFSICWCFFVFVSYRLCLLLFFFRNVYLYARDNKKGRNLLLRDINLIHENCETFNGRGVLISQNAHLVARTFIGYLDEQGFGGGASMGGAGAGRGGSIYSSYGGGAEDVCPACGVRFEGGVEGGVPVLSCQACGVTHHAICVVDGKMGRGGIPEDPWVCVACGREN